ncbi:MAG: ORF6N domain-containing protein [Elusimicrobia bacterium]|nr:ORF6N domain-containing protein [Elusimicrobiota bacterium]
MKKKNLKDVISGKILFIRNQKVMLDQDLAKLYGVETKSLNQAVKKKIKRFPKDFMFQLNKKEFEDLKSRFATSSWKDTYKPPYVFSELGVVMLSSVLKSKIATQLSIIIMRTVSSIGLLS